LLGWWQPAIGPAPNPILPTWATSAQAEYAGLIAGLAAALELGCNRLKVQGDSTLIINQVSGSCTALLLVCAQPCFCEVGLTQRQRGFVLQHEA